MVALRFSDPAMAAAAVELPLSMLLVFGSAKLAGELSERLRQPAIVGEILAGIALGPALLGWVRPNELLHTLAELGVMFLLFNVGLHTRAHELKSVGGTATLVAVAGVILPMFAGWAILTLASHTRIESFFLGAAMVATSVGITAQVLQSGGYLHLPASRIILAAAVIDDILGLLVLAIVSSLAKGAINWTEIAITATLAITFVIFVVQFGARAAERIIPRVRESMRAAESDFAIAITLLFALALLSVYAGVAAIIGAFLAGMMLSSTTGERARLFTQGASELLVPFFLVSIGLNLNLSVFAQSSTLILAAFVLLAAILSKLLGCGLAALPFGRTDAFRIGVGMIPRGEVGMVVAQIGLTLHVISAPVYAITVFMAVATTMVAPPLLKLAYRGAIPFVTADDEHPPIG